MESLNDFPEKLINDLQAEQGWLGLTQEILVLTSQHQWIDLPLTVSLTSDKELLLH